MNRINYISNSRIPTQKAQNLSANRLAREPAERDNSQINTAHTHTNHMLILRALKAQHQACRVLHVKIASHPSAKLMSTPRGRGGREAT